MAEPIRDPTYRLFCDAKIKSCADILKHHGCTVGGKSGAFNFELIGKDVKDAGLLVSTGLPGDVPDPGLVKDLVADGVQSVQVRRFAGVVVLEATYPYKEVVAPEPIRPDSLEFKTSIQQPEVPT